MKTKFHLCFLVAVFGFAWSLTAQDNGVTVRGKIVNPDRDRRPIDPNELELKLIEQVQFDPLPLPDEWSQMTMQQQKSWLAEFRESRAGKAYFAKRQQQLEQRKQFDIDVEEDGKFTLFDVPKGQYGLTGYATRQVEQQAFAFEIFAQVEIGPVDEVQLGEIALVTTRLLKPGESAPEFKVTRFGDTDQVLRLADYKGSYVLLNFWSAQSPPCVTDMKRLRETRSELDKESVRFQMLSVCIDNQLTPAEKLIAEESLNWDHAACGGWSGDMVESFGVRSIPYYCLIDKEGKILVNNELFYQLFQAGQNDLSQILRLSLAGKDMQKVLEEAIKNAERGKE